MTTAMVKDLLNQRGGHQTCMLRRSNSLPARNQRHRFLHSCQTKLWPIGMDLHVITASSPTCNQRSLNTASVGMALLRGVMGDMSTGWKCVDSSANTAWIMW